MFRRKRLSVPSAIFWDGRCWLPRYGTAFSRALAEQLRFPHHGPRPVGFAPDSRRIAAARRTNAMGHNLWRALGGTADDQVRPERENVYSATG
jgi:hypothetical protein